MYTFERVDLRSVQIGTKGLYGNFNSVFVLVLNKDHQTNLHADTPVQFVFFDVQRQYCNL